MTLDDKIKETQSVIKKAADKSEHPVFVNFSGGKDSCALPDCGNSLWKVVHGSISGGDMAYWITCASEQCEYVLMTVIPGRLLKV